MWEPYSSPYTVGVVTDPEKKKKYYGMKKFTAFDVTVVSHHGNHTVCGGGGCRDTIQYLKVYSVRGSNIVRGGCYVLKLYMYMCRCLSCILSYRMFV